jgi:anti-anti-sigma regulatory factor/nucleotide-binding universal stress UspA family protein
LPTFSLPPLDWQGSVALLPASFVVALVSFMEAMSSAKVIAIRTREPWNENRELIGQGLAKIAAAFCNSMTVSGSFSRSALNLAANAKSAFSSVVSALFVVLTLFVLTPLLHHLPKAVLAAIIMMAVASLVNVRSLRNAWLANIDDGCEGLTTFAATLVFAPNIQFGILTGILLSLALLLYRIMRPRAVVLGLADGALHALHDAHHHNIAPLGPQMGALRFDRALLFVNVSYFEDALLELERAKPNLTHILIKCNGINHLDASGVEMLFNQIDRFRRIGITIAFSGLQRQVYEVMVRTGLVREIDAQNIFATDRDALEGLRPHWDVEVCEGHSNTHNPPRLIPEPKAAAKPSTSVVAPFKGGAIRVLVPLDANVATLRAVDEAILMAKNVEGGKVVLLNTQTATIVGTGAADTDAAGQPELRSAIALCEQSGVTFEICNAPGPFVETTVRIAEQNADHIVMMTAGARSLFDRLRGSQATRIAERAQVPVTLVK